MTRILVLHCGPMKTGSTAIQDILQEQRQKLSEVGIGYHHIPAKDLLDNLCKAIYHERVTANKVVLVSSEFFGQVSPVCLKKIINIFNGSAHAILVSRPLREVYPSLYLQNLKGSSRRITSFRYFLDNQINLDSLNPEKHLVGQLMNAPVLDSRLSSAGCVTHWIRYSKETLIRDFFDLLGDISKVNLDGMDAIHLAKPSKLSARRSLRMEFSGLARGINFLNRKKILADYLRELLLVLLLNLSDFLNFIPGQRSPLSEAERERCDAVDRSINKPFLISRGLKI